MVVVGESAVPNYSYTPDALQLRSIDVCKIKVVHYV